MLDCIVPCGKAEESRILPLATGILEGAKLWSQGNIFFLPGAASTMAFLPAFFSSSFRPRGRQNGLMGPLDAQRDAALPKVPVVSKSTCEPKVGSSGCGPSPQLVSWEAQGREPQTPETKNQCVWDEGRGCMGQDGEGRVEAELAGLPPPAELSLRKRPASLSLE